jgi:Flp pilus assembly pilin Flp
MRTLRRWLAIFSGEEGGQGLVEYTLLLAFLAMASAGVLTQLGVTVQGPWSTASATLDTASGSTPSDSTTNPSGGNDGHGGHGDHGGDGH